MIIIVKMTCLSWGRQNGLLFNINYFWNFLVKVKEKWIFLRNIGNKIRSWIRQLFGIIMVSFQKKPILVLSMQKHILTGEHVVFPCCILQIEGGGWVPFVGWVFVYTMFWVIRCYLVYFYCIVFCLVIYLILCTM